MSAAINICVLPTDMIEAQLMFQVEKAKHRKALTKCGIIIRLQTKALGSNIMMEKECDQLAYHFHKMTYNL